MCLAGELLLVLLDSCITYADVTSIGAMRRLFNMAGEENLPTWFSSTQTLLAGLTLGLVYWSVRRDPTSGKRAFGWLILAILFTYMSIDDAAVIHERVGTAFRKLATGPKGAGANPSALGGLVDVFPTYTWQLVYGPIFGSMGIFMLWFLWREFQRVGARVFLIVGLGCYVLAVALDFVEGIRGLHQDLALRWELDRYTVGHLSRVLEEYLEMVGTTALLVGFLRFLTMVTDRMQITIEHARAERSLGHEESTDRLELAGRLTTPRSARA